MRTDEEMTLSEGGSVASRVTTLHQMQSIEIAQHPLKRLKKARQAEMRLDED